MRHVYDKCGQTGQDRGKRMTSDESPRTGNATRFMQIPLKSVSLRARSLFAAASPKSDLMLWIIDNISLKTWFIWLTSRALESP
jgi:hypothetical protein